MRNQWGFVRNSWGVTATNTAPVANAGANQAGIAAGSTVTLDFSGSTDGDGTIASYAVTQTTGDMVTLSGSGASRTFTAPTTGSAQTLTFSLVVTDDDGADSAPDTVDIGVLAAVIPDTAKPVIILSPATLIYNLNVGDTFTLPTATLTDNVDATISISPASNNVDTALDGNYSVVYSGYQDAAGNAADPVVITVNVSAVAIPDNPPTVIITAPTTSTEGETVTLTANPLPASGTFTYLWRVIAGGVTLSSTTEQTVTYTAPASTTTVTIGVVANDGTTNSQEAIYTTLIKGTTMKSKMIKLVNGAEFGSDRVQEITPTLILVDATGGHPILSCESDPGVFLELETYSKTGMLKIEIARGVKYKIALNGGSVWISDTLKY